MNKTTSNIIELNNERIAATHSEYDPIRGVGSPLERISIELKNGKSISLPKIAAEDRVVQEILEAGSLLKYATKQKRGYATTTALLAAIRLKYDFEFWAATCVKVQDKSTKRPVPFILRSPQRKLLAALYQGMERREPIRVVLLKARQWGGSTLVQIFMAWIQLFHRRGWHSAIITDVEDQARNIRSMYSRLAQHYPKELGSITFSGFEGSSKNKIIKEREAIIYMGSMQRPDSLRSSDVMMAHLSEVGLWKSTLGKSPEDVVQAIAGTVPMEELSMIVVESTAKGVGNYFHRLYTAAERGENGFTPLFVPWYEIELYTIAFKDEDEKIAFIESLSSEEMSYFNMGATLEGIKWHRRKRLSDGYDAWRMGCEFPTTPAEAFQSTGRRAHNPAYTAAMRQYCSPPIYVGEVGADSQQGRSAIDGSLKFFAQAGGSLWIWAHADKETRIRNRYIVSMDIGGRTDSADYSVISVIDRIGLIDGGREECIATARFHLDQDLAIWRAVQIATLYNNALLVIEANSLNSKASDGDHTLTILDEIKDIYPNLYARSDIRAINGGRPVRYGFFTSSASKTDLVNQMNKRMREQDYIEHDARAIDEADCYEIKSNGSYGAVDGEHDDIYMSRAIGLKASQIHDSPSIVVTKTRAKKKIASESSF